MEISLNQYTLECLAKKASAENTSIASYIRTIIRNDLNK